MGAAGSRPTVTVVHRDADLLVLDKPSGLVTTRPDPGPSLVEAAKALDPHAPRLHPSSRLDAEVSGLVTFARTKRATEGLLAARRRGEYRRLYVGIAVAPPQPLEGCWDAAIALDARDKRRRVAVEAPQMTDSKAPGIRAAATHYRVQAQLPHAVLLALWPQTGRTHQLRVHAAHAGAAFLGDRVYGGAARVTLADGRVVRAPRVMLHCAQLCLPAIGKGQALQLRAAIPGDMQALWEALGGDVEQLRDAGREDRAVMAPA